MIVRLRSIRRRRRRRHISCYDSPDGGGYNNNMHSTLVAGHSIESASHTRGPDIKHIGVRCTFIYIYTVVTIEQSRLLDSESCDFD